MVIGGGFAGLNATHALRHADVDVTLVDKNNYHTFQPLLYQVSTAYLSPEDVGAALRAVFRRQRNASIAVGLVAGVDHGRRIVRLEDGRELPFDYLIITAGAESNFFGIEGMAENAWPLYTLTDAIRLRLHLLRTLEAALVRQPDPLTTVVVVGGGPTGVETSGALASMACEVVGAEVRLRVVLVEAAPRLLPGGFSEQSSARALADLRARGVEVRLDTSVTAADPTGVSLAGGDRIEAATIVWAAGVQANGLGRRLDVTTVRHGRIAVDERLCVPGQEGIFAAGDVAAVPTGADGSALPMLAPAAIQTGRHAGEQVARLVAGKALTPFRYRDKGMVAVLGRGDAVAEIPLSLRKGAGRSPTLRFGGRLAWLLWLGVHIVYLIGFRNRLKVLVDWGWTYLTSRGGGAILVADIVSPRDREPVGVDLTALTTPASARGAGASRRR